jgi:hypothetical protein
MNIFILDKDPVVAARYHVDKHVLSAIREIATMMNGGWRYHKCTRWIHNSRSNWRWVKEHVDALHKEWQYRWNHAEGEYHKSC